MQTPDASSPQGAPVSRRQLLWGTMTAAVAAAAYSGTKLLSGPQAPKAVPQEAAPQAAAPQPQSGPPGSSTETYATRPPQGPPGEPSDGYDLYAIVPADLDTFWTAQPDLLGLGWARVAPPERGAAPTHFVGWLKHERAAELAKRPENATVRRFVADDIAEMTVHGTPESSLSVSVQIYPNETYVDNSQKTFASVDAVAASWSRQFAKHRGVRVLVVVEQPQKPLHEAQELPYPGQILIESDTRPIPAEIMETVKAHPQTYVLHWGRVYTYLHCPPCGMG